MGMPLTTGQRDVKLTHSNGAGKRNLFLSSSSSVNIWQHPSALLSRVAETARILAQSKSILLAKSVTKKLDHNRIKIINIISGFVVQHKFVAVHYA